ncbi:MAG: NUDIX hydrolase, partial [Anaerolineales bacterium]
RPDGTESRQQAFFPPDELPVTSPWYADMVHNLFAARVAAFFELPRHQPPGADGAHLRNLRSLVGQTELIAPGAGAFIRDERGHLLLIRRADNSMWSVPAGMMDLGENIAETVVRETREETGLIVEPTRLIGAYSGPEYRIVYPNGDPIQICSAVFECRILGGQPRADGVETTDVRFFPLDDLPSLMPARVVNRIAEAAHNLPHALWG